jgi:lipopolysaccharide transport system ATP-binding protein
MSNIVISIEDLSKLYRIGEIGTGSFYGDFKRWWARQRGKPDPDLKIGETDQGKREGEAIWALKDVTFTVRQGEAVGIIGRNGAGKSTLLKILSRVTVPTSGVVKVKGRIASLLEVGTGFHPELTGRENIFLNGAVMGMNRSEVKRKFDEIVDFSGVEQFIDTPVKRYSSGMYIRLAFAVAAHLEPEILIVDEVLAVGDAEFQSKCLGKMDDAAKHGRTVLFVSHNVMSVISLCTRAIWLKDGRITQSGSVDSIVEQYLQSIRPTTAIQEKIIPLEERTDRRGNGDVTLTSISVEHARSQENSHHIYSSDQLRIRVGYQATRTFGRLRFLISINDHANHCIYFLDSDIAGGLPSKLPAVGFVTCITGSLRITSGQYYINIALFNRDDLADHVKYAYKLAIEPEDFYGTGKIPPRQQSACLIEQSWSNQEPINEN